jgi:mutator protein MutT
VSSPPARRPGGDQVIPRPPVWRDGDPAPWAGLSALPLAELLARVAQRPTRDLAPPFPGARNSAVLAVLLDGDAGPEVLLTRRAAHLRNHRGEISFPGGRMDPGETPAETAVREAAEEVGLDPALVVVHGELDHLSTVVSNSYIVPVVASVAGRPTLVAAPQEVDRVLWVPLAELARADTYREEWWGAPPLDRPLHFFELDDETIWGATGRMLLQLLCLTHGLEVPPHPGAPIAAWAAALREPPAPGEPPAQGPPANRTAT